MSVCECEPKVLSAYLDGELSPMLRERVEAHVRGCPTCAAELAKLRETIVALKEYPFPTLSTRALANIHDAVDDASAEQPVWRLGLTVGALAASILIICSVWLWDLTRTPAVTTTGGVSTQVVVAPPASWERVAITLRVDPLPQELTPDDNVMQLADARLADWMLSGLNPSPSPPVP
ncbi:MAG TPA: zf-HC2 domain-containing protein [Tepidisphaeraceae bacterium]|jgi:anti-sigma factor RsiW